MIFKTCEYCGAHLDPGEDCDCRREELPVERRGPQSGGTAANRQFIHQKGGSNECR